MAARERRREVTAVPPAGTAVPLRAAVLGHPVDHSLSPRLHAAAHAVLGLDGAVYGRHDLEVPGLADFLDTHAGHTGFSLTMPLKHALVDLARERGWDLDETAELTGAGNTWVSHAHGSRPPSVHNTDVTGITEAVRRACGDEDRTEVGILGNGATAASATLAAHRLGARRLVFHVRTRSRATAVAELARRLGMEVAVEDLADWTPGSQPLVLSTLPAGALDGRIDPTPASLSRSHAILDVAYAHGSSALVDGYRRAGARGIEGSAMLIHQAVEQVLLFTGLDEHGITPGLREELVVAMQGVL